MRASRPRPPGVPARRLEWWGSDQGIEKFRTTLRRPPTEVPKADPGGVRCDKLSTRKRTRWADVASINYPLIRPSATFSPTEKRGGEGARLTCREKSLIGGLTSEGKAKSSNSRTQALSRRPPIERLLPPRFLRGEKVAKPDEGGVRCGALSLRKRVRWADVASINYPLIRPSATFSPTEKRGGEGARLGGDARVFTQCMKLPLPTTAPHNIPFASSSSAFNSAAPAAPRMVLWTRATMRMSRRGQGRRRPTVTAMPCSRSRSRRGWGRSGSTA